MDGSQLGPLGAAAPIGPSEPWPPAAAVACQPWHVSRVVFWVPYGIAVSHRPGTSTDMWDQA